MGVAVKNIRRSPVEIFSRPGWCMVEIRVAPSCVGKVGQGECGDEV